MQMMMEQKWPVFARHQLAVEWLRVWADLGRAPRTIDAYARALAEYLLSCENAGVDPIAASRAQVAAFVRELTSRPNRLGANWFRWTPARGWRTRRCSSDWSRCGCSTTT